MAYCWYIYTSMGIRTNIHRLVEQHFSNYFSKIDYQSEDILNTECHSITSEISQLSEYIEKVINICETNEGQTTANFRSSKTCSWSNTYSIIHISCSSISHHIRILMFDCHQLIVMAQNVCFYGVKLPLTHNSQAHFLWPFLPEYCKRFVI